MMALRAPVRPSRPDQGLRSRPVRSATAERCHFELSEVEAAVGPRSFERGRAYARGGRVVEVEWSPDGANLTGSVVGQGAVYATQAFFAAGPTGALEFEDGECTCPVGYNCKHVAAVVVAAASGPAQGRRPRSPSAVAAPAAPPAWEQPLRALIEAPAVQAAGDPLAIELSLQASGLAGGGAPGAARGQPLLLALRRQQDARPQHLRPAAGVAARGGRPPRAAAGPRGQG